MLAPRTNAHVDQQHLVADPVTAFVAQVSKPLPTIVARKSPIHRRVKNMIPDTLVGLLRWSSWVAA
jgi:hypothetical protein